MYRLRRKVKTKVVFFGHRLTRLPDNFVREALRVYVDGGRVAVIQKNGNVGMKGTGIFDDENNKHARLAAAEMLLGLKMTSPEFVAARQRERDEHMKTNDVEQLKDEADRLGFMLVAFDKAKRGGAEGTGKRRDRTDPEGGIPGRV